MSKFPENTSDQTIQDVDDFDVLADAAMTLARYMLERYETFHPFAMALTVFGVIVDIDADENPRAFVSGAIENLRATLSRRCMLASYRASVLCYDVIIARSDDDRCEAVAMELNHRNGASVVRYFVYNQEGDAVTLRDVVEVEGSDNVFLARPLS